MEADAAKDVRARLNLTVAAATKNGRKSVDGNETAEGIRNIGIRSRSPVKEKSPERSLQEEPAKIQFAKYAVLGKEKIEADDLSIPAGNAIDFAHR